MNFANAIIAMKEGKEVYRKGDLSKRYIDSDSFTFEDIEATDWEIYEDEDNWNLKSKGLLDEGVYISESNGVSYVCTQIYAIEDVATLKQKIFKDIDNLESMEENYDNIKEIIDKRFGL